MSDAILMSKRLQDFIHDSIGYGTLIVEKVCPMIPIVNVWQAGRVEVDTMMDVDGDTAGFCDHFIGELPPQAEMYAIIRDAKASLNGQQSHVLVVEAEERGMKSSVRFTQTFVPGCMFRKFRTVGLPRPSGMGKQRFQESVAPATSAPAGAQWPPKTDGSPWRNEEMTLAGNLLPFAQDCLSKRGDFFAFGAIIRWNGELAHHAPYTDTPDKALMSEMKDQLIQGLKSIASQEQIRAGCIVTNTSLQFPGQDSTSAIKLHLEHTDGIPVDLFVPYRQDGTGRLSYGQLINRPSQPTILTART